MKDKYDYKKILAKGTLLDAYNSKDKKLIKTLEKAMDEGEVVALY